MLEPYVSATSKVNKIQHPGGVTTCDNDNDDTDGSDDNDDNDTDNTNNNYYNNHNNKANPMAAFAPTGFLLFYFKSPSTSAPIKIY